MLRLRENAQSWLRATLRTLFYVAKPVDSPVPRPSIVSPGYYVISNENGKEESTYRPPSEFYDYLGVADPVCEDMIVRWAARASGGRQVGARVQYTIALTVCAVCVRAHVRA